MLIWLDHQPWLMNVQKLYIIDLNAHYKSKTWMQFFLFLVSFAGLGITMNMMIYMFNITCIFSRAPKIQLPFFWQLLSHYINYYIELDETVQYEKKLLFDQHSLQIARHQLVSVDFQAWTSLQSRVCICLLRTHTELEYLRLNHTLRSVCQKTFTFMYYKDDYISNIKLQLYACSKSSVKPFQWQNTRCNALYPTIVLFRPLSRTSSSFLMTAEDFLDEAV